MSHHTLCFFLFFLIQQFITWSVRGDCGSYFYNYIQKMYTYMKKETRKRYKIEIERMKKN